jgi:hypothetical protein
VLGFTPTLGQVRVATKLLLNINLHGYLGALPHDITLLGAQDLEDVGPMDMVIVRWLY